MSFGLDSLSTVWGRPVLLFSNEGAVTKPIQNTLLASQLFAPVEGAAELYLMVAATATLIAARSGLMLTFARFGG